MNTTPLQIQVEQIIAPIIGKVRSEVYTNMLQEIIYLVANPRPKIEAQVTGVVDLDTWPLSDVLFQMAQWLNHLHNTHDCDCHGWEVRSFLLNAALQYQDRALNASGATSPRQYAERIVGTLFHDTSASAETLEQTVIDRIESAEIARRASHGN